MCAAVVELHFHWAYTWRSHYRTQNENNHSKEHTVCPLYSVLHYLLNKSTVSHLPSCVGTKVFFFLLWWRGKPTHKREICYFSLFLIWYNMVSVLHLRFALLNSICWIPSDHNMRQDCCHCWEKKYGQIIQQVYRDYRVSIWNQTHFGLDENMYHDILRLL